MERRHCERLEKQTAPHRHTHKQQQEHWLKAGRNWTTQPGGSAQLICQTATQQTLAPSNAIWHRSNAAHSGFALRAVGGFGDTSSVFVCVVCDGRNRARTGAVCSGGRLCFFWQRFALQHAAPGNGAQQKVAFIR